MRDPLESGIEGRMKSARPFSICYDFDSEEDGCVTIRFRDSMEQKRVRIKEMTDFIRESLSF